MTIDIDNTDRIFGLIIAFGAVSGLVIGWVRWWRPKIRRARHEIVAVRDAILGRDEIRDSITGESRVPALPGMGKRMATTEANVEKLTEVVTKLTEAHLRFDNLESHVANLDGRVEALEAGTVERVVARAESAQAWRTIEKAIQAEPDEAPDLD